MKKIHINPLLLIIFNFLIPLCAMTQSLRFSRPFFIAFSSIILLMEGCYKRFIKFTILYLIFYAILISSIHITEGPFKNMLYSTFTVWVGIFPVLIIASMIIYNNTPGEIISALQKLHLPRVFIIALTITIRYLPTFKQEFSIMKESMRLRGLDISMGHPLKRFEYFIVPQLFRCSLLANELTAAGLTKGIDAPFTRSGYIDTSLKPIDLCLLIIFIVGSIMGYFIT